MRRRTEKGCSSKGCGSLGGINEKLRERTVNSAIGATEQSLYVGESETTNESVSKCLVVED